MVPEGRQARPEPSPELFGDRDLEDAAVLAGLEPAPLPELAAPEGFKEQRLVREAAVEKDPGGFADGDRGPLRADEDRQARRRLFPRDQEIQALATDSAGFVLGFVDQAISPGFEPRNCHRRQAVRVVLGLARRRFRSLLPEPEDCIVRKRIIPARPEAVARRPEKAGIARPRRRLGQRLVGGEEGRLRLDEPDDAPGPRARPRSPVEICPRDREGARRSRALETVFLPDRSFDAHEPQPEGPFRRTRLASLVGDVDREGVAIAEARPGAALPLVGARGEGHVDGPVIRDPAPAAGDDLRAAAFRRPPPPARIDRLAPDLPDSRARRDRKAEVIAGLGLERRGAVEPQRLVRVLDCHLERRPFVLLDAHSGVAFRRGPEAPGAEGASRGRDDELAAGRPEAVRRRGRLGHALAVDVLEPDRGGGVRRRLELAQVLAAPVGQDLPVELLAGAVDAPVGVD